MTRIHEAMIVRVKDSHLVVSGVGDELVVFDRRTHKAHLLNRQSAAIFQEAENGCSLSHLAKLMDGATAQEKLAAARLGVADLDHIGLLMSDIEPMPRRRLLKALGAAAAAPAVISILAPTPAAAATSCCTVTAGSATLDGSTCNPFSPQFSVTVSGGCTFNYTRWGSTNCTGGSSVSSEPGPIVIIFAAPTDSLIGTCTPT